MPNMSKDCQVIQSLIMDGPSVSLEEAESIQKHIQHCSACMQLYKTNEQIDSCFEAMEQSIPNGLHESIMSSIHKTPQDQPIIIKKSKSNHASHMRAWIGACAAAFIFVIALTTVIRSGHVLKSSGNTSFSPSAEMTDRNYYNDGYVKSADNNNLSVQEYSIESGHFPLLLYTDGTYSYQQDDYHTLNGTWEINEDNLLIIHHEDGNSTEFQIDSDLQCLQYLSGEVFWK